MIALLLLSVLSAATPDLWAKSCLDSVALLADCSADEDVCAEGAPCTPANAAAHNNSAIRNLCPTVGPAVVVKIPAGTWHVRGSIPVNGCAFIGEGSQFSHIVQVAAVGHNVLLTNTATLDEAIPHDVTIKGISFQADRDAKSMMLLTSYHGGNRVHISDVRAIDYYNAIKADTHNWVCGDICEGGSLVVVDSYFAGLSNQFLAWGHASGFVSYFSRVTFGHTGVVIPPHKPGHVYFKNGSDVTFSDCDFIRTNQAAGSSAIIVQGEAEDTRGVVRVLNSRFGPGVKRVLNNTSGSHVLFVGNDVHIGGTKTDQVYYGIFVRGPLTVRDSYFHGSYGREIIYTSSNTVDADVVIENTVFDIEHGAIILARGPKDSGTWFIRNSTFRGDAKWVYRSKMESGVTIFENSRLLMDDSDENHTTIEVVSGGNQLRLRNTEVKGAYSGIKITPAEASLTK